MKSPVELWTDALESGEYPQARTFLCTLEDGQPVGYCCFGVACELYQQHVGGLTVEDNDYARTYNHSYDSGLCIPPKVVRDWLDINCVLGFYRDADHSGFCSLASDNDGGKSFAEIAATIKARPEGLFN